MRGRIAWNIQRLRRAAGTFSHKEAVDVYWGKGKRSALEYTRLISRLKNACKHFDIILTNDKHKAAEIKDKQKIINLGRMPAWRTAREEFAQALRDANKKEFNCPSI